jgi:hypothetical protein
LIRIKWAGEHCSRKFAMNGLGNPAFNAETFIYQQKVILQVAIDLSLMETKIQLLQIDVIARLSIGFAFMFGRIIRRLIVPKRNES